MLSTYRCFHFIAFLQNYIVEILNKSLGHKRILLLGLSHNQIFIYVSFILLKNEIRQRWAKLWIYSSLKHNLILQG